METNKLKELSKEELTERLDKKKSELSETLYDKHMGREADTSKAAKLKKEIARILSLLKLKEKAN